MAYCAKCRELMRTRSPMAEMLAGACGMPGPATECGEVLSDAAWCPHCERLVGVSHCKVPAWVLGIVLLLSLCPRILVG